jgi:hypothetical protein
LKMAEKDQPGRKWRLLRSLIVGFLSLLIIILALVFCIIRFAPNTLSPLVLRELRRQGLDVAVLEIRKISLQQTVFVLKGINLGAIHAQKLPVELNYTFEDLKLKRVRHVVVRGVALRVDANKGSGTEPFDYKDIPSLVFKSYPATLPFESATITQSFLEFHHGSKTDPFMSREFQAKVHADGQFSFKSQDLEVSGSLDPEKQNAEVTFTANGTEPMQWLDLLEVKLNQILDCDLVNMNAGIHIKKGRFHGGEVAIRTKSITTKDARLEDINTSIVFVDDLATEKFYAKITLHVLKASGFGVSPVPLEIKWENDGKLTVSPQENTGAIKIWKGNDIDAAISDFEFSTRLDETHKPGEWQLSVKLPEINLKKQGITLSGTDFEKRFDGQHLTASIKSKSAAVNDLPISEIIIDAKASSNALNLKGEMDFAGVKIPFQADSQTDALGRVIEVSQLVGKPDPETIDLDAILNIVNFSIGPIELMENPILNLLPSGLPESYVSGKIQLSGSLMDDAYSLMVDNASVHFPENDLRISEVNTSVSFSLDNGLHTLDDATLGIGSLKASKLEIRNGSLPFSILPGNVVRTLGGSFVGLGGRILLGPTTLQPNGYDTITTGILFFEDIDFQQLLQLAETPPLELKGRFDGQLPFVYQKHGLELQSGYLRMNPNSSGRLQYDANGSFTRNIPPGTQQFKNMQLAERALLGLDLSEMELKLFLQDKGGRELPARAIIKGTYEEKNRKINLDLTLNLRGEVEKILRNAAKGKLDLSFGF